MRRSLVVSPFVALAACVVALDTGDSASTVLDLSETLGADEVRAGVVAQRQDLFGGISAEGTIGDFKIYNDRARFIIEAVGDSNYYMDYGGSLIDADIVRPAGQPGRDLVDELAPMVSLARIVDATAVTVVSDGSDGAAIIRVEGRGAPLRLATGAVENPDLVPDYDLRIVTDYTLLPGEYALTAKTTVYNEDSTDFIASIGLFGIVAQEVASFWRPGTGFDDPDSRDHAMQALVGNKNEGVIALMAEEGLLSSSALGEVVSGLAAGITAFGSAQTVAPGQSVSWTARIGVGPDLAALETERLARAGAADSVLESRITDTKGQSIAGARVTLLDAAGEPLTVAFTDENGDWTASVGEAVSYVATGRGTGEVLDIPAGHGNISPYDRSHDDALLSLTQGAVPVPFAEGYGVAQGSLTELGLTPPGIINVVIEDGGPAFVTVDFAAGDAVNDDRRIYPSRPSGHAAVGYVRDGTLEIPVEPGTYTITASRGVRYEVATVSATVESGATFEAPLALSAAYVLDGVITLDPHSHAAPSGDGEVSMEGRLLSMASNGIEVHFGTDHDHVADYNPALEALGMSGWLRSIVASEVSPVMRGHFNAYPSKQTGAANGSAPRWWQGVESTSALFEQIRVIVGSTGIIQANHPVSSSGMFTRSDYSPAEGTVGESNRWSNDFNAMELLNSNDYAEFFPYYADLAARGKRVTPVGVSDSHSIRSGDPGLNLTFLNAGVAFADFGPDDLVRAMANQATVVSHGPYLEATIDGEWAPGQETSSKSVDIRVLAPSWIPVDTLKLWRDGVEIESVACDGAAPEWCLHTFTFPTDSDGSYIVTAESIGLPITQVWPGSYAWSATAAISVDVGGDGWTAPKAALIIEE